MGRLLKNRLFKRILSLVLTLAVLCTSLGLEQFAASVQAQATYTYIYLKDDTAEHWLGNDNAVMEMVDNTSRHVHYQMAKINSTTWRARVPATVFNVTFNRLDPSGSTQWNSWSAGGRGSNRNDISTWHSTYHATVPEHGYWDGEAEYEEGFHQGDVIYLDYYEFSSWEMSNALFYANFTDASKAENNGLDIDLSTADSNKYSPINLTDEIEDMVFTYTVTAEDEGAAKLRFWRGNGSTLWNNSVVLSYSDYQAGNNCVKVQGWNGTGYVCPYVPRRHIPVFTTLELDVAGNKKVNRKVNIDFDIQGETEYLNTEDTRINIVKLDSDGNEISEDITDVLAFDITATAWNHRELLFKESGTYKITGIATDGTDEYSDEKIITIVNDNVPAAGLELSVSDESMGEAYEDNKFARNADGILELNIADMSSSELGDDISTRKYTIYYDSNNNGEYEDSEIVEEINRDNEDETNVFTRQFSGIGKYKAALHIKESFTDTIPSLLTDDDYLEADTYEEFEIINKAPASSMSVKKSKIADIIFTVSNADSDKIAEYASASEMAEDRLDKLGIEANVSTVSASALTATDTFAWTEYDHCNFNDWGQVLPNHIQYTGKDIKMVGYYYAPFKDFLYIKDNDCNKKIFEFDLQRDNTDWHSMEGGGFLFNTEISEEENYIQGYCVLVTAHGLKLVQINKTNLTGFRNSTEYVQNAGRLLQTFPLTDLYSSHHIKIIINGNTITVYDGENLVINEYVLPDDGVEAFGYGPITSHESHGCYQQSYFTFKNIIMQTVTGESLSDVVNNHEWTPGDNHYVISLSETSVPELSDIDRMSDVTAALISNNAAFYGIGNSTTINQYNALLNSIDGKGENIELTAGNGNTEDNSNDENNDSDITVTLAVNQIAEAIISDINSKSYDIDYVISSDEKVEYTGDYSDPENDDKGEEIWNYEYNPNAFAEDNGAENDDISVITQSTPITMFTNTGAYTITHRVSDNPAKDNDALMGYSLWSEEDDYEKLILSQHRPVAHIDVAAAQSPSDSSICMINVQYSAYDEDHMSDIKKGIRSEEFYYKKLTDENWTTGRFPASVQMGSTYLIKYIVTDVEGTKSRPQVVTVKTNEAREYVEPEDTNPPTINLTVSDTVVEVGNKFYIEASAQDDYGVTEFIIKCNDEEIGTSFGRFDCDANEAGEYAVTVTAKDIGGNISTDTKTVRVIDNTDVTPPTIDITSPVNGNISGDTDIIGTIKDDKKLKSYTVTRSRAATSQYEENNDTITDTAPEVIASGTDEIVEGKIAVIETDSLSEGMYRYEILATDMAGHQTSVSCIVTVTKDNSDRTAPQAYISDIVLDSANGTISVYGTVTDDNEISEYQLHIQKADGTSEPVLIGSGDSEADEAILGTIYTDNLESGEYLLTLTAYDSQQNKSENAAGFTYTKGNDEEQDYSIDVNADLTAPVILAEVRAAISDGSMKLKVTGTIDDENLASYDVVTGKLDENGNIVNSAVAAAGTAPVIDGDIAAYTYPAYEAGKYGVKITAADIAGNQRTVTYTITVKSNGLIDDGYNGEDENGEDSIDSLMKLTLSKVAAYAGESVDAYISYPQSASDIRVLAYSDNDNNIPAQGVSIELVGRSAAITSENAGEITVVLSANIDGENKTVKQNIRFFDKADTTHPSVDFVSPEADSNLNAKTDIYATITDETSLAYYVLEYKPDAGDNEEYRELARGTEAVTNEKIAELDTTLLMNGSYVLRITAVDNGGNRMRVERRINVTGNLKVGNMSLGFTDINSNVAGIPLTVTRNYDSRNKSSGDFGYGWSMGVLSARLTESHPINDGYELVKQGTRFSTGYYMSQNVSHDITVTYGDGSSDKFKLKLSPERSALIPICEVEVTFQCETNKKVKLEIDGDNHALVSGSQLIFEDSDMLESRNYILTREDGTKLYISPEYGMLKMEDANGNTVKVTKNGYKHSSGNSIIFTRDKFGRVIKAQEKNSDKEVINEINYSYDASGNLSSVTDYVGRTVTFTYDNDHNLIDIIDPSGAAIARNIYDEDGRLIATIDGDGNRIEYEHDLDAKMEVIRDKLGNAAVYYYDDNGNVLRTVDALGNVTESTYDENNHILTSTDALGNVTTYNYDSDENLSSLTTPEGVVEAVSYNQLNIVTGITLDGDALAAFDYDSKGNLTKETDALGNETELDYQSDGKLTGITDSIGTVQAFTYDDDGNLLSMTDGNGSITKYNYNQDGQCTGVTVRRTDADGIERDYTSVYTYDAAGNVQTATSPDGKVTAYEYDFRNNKTAVITPDGKRTQYTYDNQDNLTGAAYPDGTSESFTYDANGNTISAISRMGVSVSMEYDSLNRLVKKTYADGAEECYTYDANGNVLTHTAVSGGVTSYAYDSMNRNTSITDAYGNVTAFEYNERSYLTKRTDALGNEFEYQYDANGSQTKLVYPDGSFEENAYDARGRVTARTDRNGNETVYGYDDADNLTSVTDALNGTYTYAYDETYELIQTKDANGNVTRYEYDSDGNLSKLTNAAGCYATYTYDSSGYNTAYTDCAGNSQSYAYDGNGRISSITDNDGSTSFTYDDYGRILSAADANGVISYTYDVYGRLASKTTYDLGTICYTYDSSNNISSITTSINNGSITSTTTYEYDLMDRIVRVVGHDGSVTLYEYDAAGNRTKVRHEGGLTVTYQYDACQRLVNETVTDTDGSILMYYGYTYGSAGEKTQATEAVRESGDEETARVIKTDYEYDGLLRLTDEVISVNDSVGFDELDFDNIYNSLDESADNSGDSDNGEAADEENNQTAQVLDISNITFTGSIHNQYAHDAVSNRTSKVTTVTGNACGLDENIQTGTTTCTYNNLNQLTSASYASDEDDNSSYTISYTYDLNGNLISEHGGSNDKNYTYNAKNQLITVTVSSNNAVTIESYAYDYEGNRISRQINEDGKAYYLNDTYDELTQAALELSKNSDNTYSINKYYTRGLELISADILDEDDAGSQNGASYTRKIYIQDGHGSVTALAETEAIADSSGDSQEVQTANIVTDTYVYDAYGNLLKKTGATDNDYLYTGEQYNELTGLYYLRARYMSPETGTFISMDAYAGTLDNPVSLHKYLYANANPVMYTDPSGYFSLMETSVAQSIQSTIDSVIVPYLNVKKLMSWANLAVTMYDVAGQVRLVLSGEGNIFGLVVAIAKGMIVQTLINCAAKAVLGEAAATVLKIVGIAQDMGSFIEAVKSGDPEEIIIESLRLAVSLFTLKCQCFTGDTLVSTEDGYRRIDDIKAGDYVWAYNTETGETELKEVLATPVTKTDILVHLTLSDGEEIETTMFHPFCVQDEESTGAGRWVAASNLVSGDILLTEDGQSVYVEKVWIEKLEEEISVYNLEVDEWHTYFVAGGVLVHNACPSQELREDLNKNGIFQPNDGNKYAAHHIVAYGAAKASRAREILEILGIDRNSASNGVFLPQGDFGKGANHNSLHTHMYYEKVNLLIEKAYGMDGNKKQNVEDMLKLIGSLLENDLF